MLNKLKRELERFRIASDADSIEDMKDAAFNASVTAWPLLRPFRDQWNLVELFKRAHPCWQAAPGPVRYSLNAAR